MFERIPKARENSLLAGLFLAFLATAGLYYVNIMPAVVSGLIEALGFSEQQAGYVASANMYGAASGSLVVIALIKRVPWRGFSLASLLGLIAFDLGSQWVSTPEVMIPLRFVHGFIGGLLIGTAFSVIARTAQPDRTFGMLLFVQFGLGGLGVMLIPGLVPSYGTSVLFLALVAFSLVTLLMLPFLPDYPVRTRTAISSGPGPAASWRPLGLALTAIFLFQAANMGLYAFIIELGRHFGLETAFMSHTLGIAAWLGLAGAGLVILIADRFGYLLPLVSSIALTVLATMGYFRSGDPAVWIVANFAIGISWAYAMSYLLGLVSRFDQTGQMAALGGFASKMGLASGPAVAAMILGDNNYPRVIGVACAVLVVALLAVIYPARVRDRIARALPGEPAPP